MKPGSAWIKFHTQALRGLLQKLKAALDDALCTFARHPAYVPPLLDRLLRSVVVQPRSLQEASSLPRADLTYQLNEIEVGSAANLSSLHGSCLYHLQIAMLAGSGSLL